MSVEGLKVQEVIVDHEGDEYDYESAILFSTLVRELTIQGEDGYTYVAIFERTIR